MPALANPRHERFVRRWLKTQNASEAYRSAGFTAESPGAIAACASRLLKAAKVQSRIRELGRSMAQKTEITALSLVEECDEARALARSTEQPAAMLQATQLKAKLTGHLIDRKESGAPGEFAGLTSADDVLDLIRRELGDGAANALQAALKPAESEAEAIEPNVEGSDSLN